MQVCLTKRCRYRAAWRLVAVILVLVLVWHNVVVPKRSDAHPGVIGIITLILTFLAEYAAGTILDEIFFDGPERRRNEKRFEELSLGSAEAKGEFLEVELGLGIVYGTLLNGVALYVSTLDRTFKDRSPAVTFGGLSSKLWDETGTAAEFKIARTTRRWEIDLRFRREETTRKFDEEAFPGFLDAEITGSGIRGELTYRPWRNFGIGIVGARSELDFLDSSATAPTLRAQVSAEDTFIGLRLSIRFVPQ